MNKIEIILPFETLYSNYMSSVSDIALELEPQEAQLMLQRASFLVARDSLAIQELFEYGMTPVVLGKMFKFLEQVRKNNIILQIKVVENDKVIAVVENEQIKW